MESRTACGRRGADAVTDIVADAASDERETTLVIASHGSWIVATIETLLGMNPDNLSNLGAMRNGFWCRLTPATSNGKEYTWTLDEFDTGPQIAGMVDWENGPSELRNDHMPLWKPIPA